MNQNIVSIIIPIYNADKYLDACLDSVINQTYQNIEVILIDDGSTDNSGTICDDYVKKNDKFKVIHNKNLGVSASRNMGLKIASGKYIYFCDSDDILHESIIEKLLNAQIKNNTSLVMCDYLKFKDIPNYSDDFNTKTKFICKEEEIYETLKYNGYLWNKIFLKQIIIDNNIFFDEEINILEDQYFIYQYIQHIDKIISFNCQLYFYRTHSLSAVNTHNEKNEMSSVIARYKIFKFFESIDLSKDIKGVFWNDAILRLLNFKKDIILKKITIRKETWPVLEMISSDIDKYKYKKKNWRLKDHIYYILFTIIKF